MPGRTAARTLFALAVLALCLPPASPARADVAADIEQACKTLGGTFEAGKSGTGDAAADRYNCVFPNGIGRACDGQGRCVFLPRATAGPPAPRPTGPRGAAAGQPPPSNEEIACSACIDRWASKCNLPCQRGGPNEQLTCRRLCFERNCGRLCPKKASRPNKAGGAATTPGTPDSPGTGN